MTRTHQELTGGYLKRLVNDACHEGLACLIRDACAESAGCGGAPNGPLLWRFTSTCHWRWDFVTASGRDWIALLMPWRAINAWPRCTKPFRFRPDRYFSRPRMKGRLTFISPTLSLASLTVRKNLTQTFSMPITWLRPLHEEAAKRDLTVSEVLRQAIAEWAAGRQITLPRTTEQV